MDFNIVFLDISELKPYENNAKKHPKEQVEKIAESIKQFGFRQPIVVDCNNEIIIGHGRFEAARFLGMEQVPCVIAEDLSDTQVKALRLIDNKTNESFWDIEALNVELAKIPDVEIDMNMFGFEEINLDPFFEEQPEYKPEKEQKIGDVFVITITCSEKDKRDKIVKLLKDNNIGYEESRQ